MSSLSSDLLDMFRTTWRQMWADHPDGLPADVMDATKAALTAQFEPMLLGQPEQVLTALQFAAGEGGTEYDVTYEFPTILLDVLTRIDHDGQVLMTVAGDQAQPWFLRRAAIQELGTRTRSDLIPLLRQVLTDDDTEGEVRTAAVFALVEQNDRDSLDLMRTLGTEEPWFDAAGPLLEGRGRLGDLTATRDLITLAADPWPHRSTPGQNGLASLEAQVGGLEPLVEALQGASDPHGPVVPRESENTTRLPDLPLVDRLHRLATTDPVAPVRNWAIARLAELDPARAAECLLLALSDPDWLVLKTSSDALSALTPAPVAELHARVNDPEVGIDERRWAARTLLLLGESVDLSTLPDAQVPLPSSVPGEVRSAIVRVYAPLSESGTDVRWLMEALILPRWSEEEAAGIVAEHGRVVQALRMAGVVVGDPVEAGDWHQQGGGTYVVLPLEGGNLSLSTLGRFAAEDDWSSEGTHSAAVLEQIRLTLASVGWQWLDETIRSVAVPGLHVYSFGRREALHVGELLFYWQD
ncbi:HEAT repeat domain-containing protein [Deinococcus sp. LM3]|uniref:HEAT repeat domain-containing protein n=1 Tax=Deinococcus sp. LM3 TaxID=1938608 RepID=UPI000993B47B|nr:HEAT repeat domain-containing protein [Deinococcus sp. LM3]OOV11980.1 hypothetical protein BXU09_18705 [Deinococcus sp. LM3]